MEKTIFGLCRRCFKIKKFEKIDVSKKGPENLKLYICKECIVKELKSTGYICPEQTTLFA